MKQIIIIALALSSFVARAQQKTDSLKSRIDTPNHPTSWHEVGHGLNASKPTDSVANFGLYTISEFTQEYRVDWTKVKTLADMKKILEVFNFIIMGHPKGFDKIKKYLIKQ